MALVATADPATFSDDPVGRCLIGDSWLYWCADPELFGIAFWGRPGLESVGALARALTVELGPGVRPHQSLVDASRLDSVDAEAFEVLSRYVRTNHDVLSERVTRLALIRPEGMTGAVTAGFFAVLDSPYPVGLFDDEQAALAWLERDAAAVEGLRDLVSNAAGLPPIVASLRAAIAGDFVSADLSAAARTLGVSDRSLQRKLHAANTTFQAELSAARLREAKRRMLESDAPLTRIALDVGYTSLSHFSTQFKKDTGHTPSKWRDANRSSD